MHKCDEMSSIDENVCSNHSVSISRPNVNNPQKAHDLGDVFVQ